MKKYQYLASWDDQTLTRVGEPVVVLGDSNVSQVEVTLPSNFLLDPTKAECRMYFLLPGEKESAHDVLETAVKDENGDSHVTWTIKHVHSQKGGRLAFSLTLIGDNVQWDSRTAIIPVYESRYQPESEEAEKPYTGRLDALEGSMAAIRGEFAEVQEDFEDIKETATLGTPIPESLVANMTEGHVYIYTGTEPGYTAGHVYYYVDGVLKDGGVYGGTAVDATLTQSGQAADAKKTGDEISAIKEDLSEYENIFTGNVDESVQNWLDAHPEATTTVQDGSITKEKLSEDMRASVDGSNINELALDSLPFMSVSENDSTAAQGLCAIDNRYVVIVKYKTDDTKAFSVYDFVTQTFVKESIFTDEQVGHCNTITYAEPYIYVATLNADKNIVRLAYDKQTHGITYDGVAYSGSEFNVKCVAYDHDKKLFYILSQTADTFALHATNDFASFTPQGQNNFQNFAYLSPQGLAASGEHVFITFSMSFRRTDADVMAEKVALLNEVIYVTNKQMELLKTNEYPRGKYGEVEDCEIVTVNNQKYILIATNQTDDHVKCVYAKPVYKQTTFIEPFFETKILDALHSTQKMLNVYVDNSRTAPFAKGTKGNPYDSVETAMKNIRLLNVPTVLTISGTYTKPCVFRYIKNPLVIQLQNATLERVAIYGCNRIHFDNNTNSTLKQLYLDWSNVSIRTPLTIGPADGSDYTSGVVAYRSFLTGSFTRIDAYKYGIQSFSSIINAFVDDNQATTPVLKSAASLVCINGNIV